MSWKVLKGHPDLKYNQEKKDVDLSNSFYNYFAYNEQDISFMLSTNFPNAVAEQSYFLSSVAALLNSVGGTNRLVKNIFFNQNSFEEYVATAKNSNVTLPYHVQAKAQGKNTISLMVIDAVDVITQAVSGAADKTTENLLGFKLSKLVPWLLAIGGLILILVFYKKLKGGLSVR